MVAMEWMLEAILVILLAATLVQAARLERALGVLKRDRAALAELVAGFNDSTRQAEAGIDRLHSTVDGAGRQIARQIDSATRLQGDLVFLAERGERLADRLDALVRAGRPLAAEPSHQMSQPRYMDPQPPAEPRSNYADPRRLETTPATVSLEPVRAMAEAEPPDPPRVRSQAERDLLKALRMVR